MHYTMEESMSSQNQIRLKLKIHEVMNVPADVRGLESVELQHTHYHVEGDTMFVTRVWRITQIKQSSSSWGMLRLLKEV